jgi:hypothetical protein
MGRAAQVMALLVVAAVGYVTRELRLIAFHTHQTSQSYEDRYYLPPAHWLPLMSLGFRAALADLIWCRSLVYFGEEMVHKGAIKYAFDYTDAVLALDPDFRSAYVWIGTASVYRGGVDAHADGLRASRYLKRATARWPNDGDLHWRYGGYLRFELAPHLPEGPERERLISLSAPHLAVAASLGAGPPWLALNSSALLVSVGQTEQAIRHLEEVYGTVQDENTKAVIEERLTALRSQAFVEALRAVNEEFEGERRSSYPYLTSALFMLVGPRQRDIWHRQVADRFLAPAPALAEAEADETTEAQ